MNRNFLVRRGCDTRDVRKFKNIGGSFIVGKVDLFGLRNVKEGLRTE
jgi:hypothetical protein